MITHVEEGCKMMKNQQRHLGENNDILPHGPHCPAQQVCVGRLMRALG